MRRGAADEEHRGQQHERRQQQPGDRQAVKAEVVVGVLVEIAVHRHSLDHQVGDERSGRDPRFHMQVDTQRVARPL